MTANAKYYTTTETAKLIRALLKRKFPNVKFSVRSSKYSGGSSIRVSWTDGPTAKLVDAYVQPFSGASFDGMQDLKSYHDCWMKDGCAYFNQEDAPAGAELVSFSADFIFTERSYTADSLERAKKAYALKWGADKADQVQIKTFEGGQAYTDGGPTWDGIEASREIRSMAARRMMPAFMPGSW